MVADQCRIARIKHARRREQICSRSPCFQRNLGVEKRHARIIPIATPDRRVGGLKILRLAVRQRFMKRRAQIAVALQCWSMNA